jgi:hypothetical protein
MLGAFSRFPAHDTLRFVVRGVRTYADSYKL